ncbi:hypothetical protein NIA71_08230 [Ihubacter massiliensis]|uniref:hypothetical protein n=1 Tax=Ihubacter massiliensis TaxID=1852367 RepID=UPI002096CAEB|nr:hypothetical protein [Ihubacter massiliensis]MCO7121937.1 hypothetical protein [Ihubacter massiliensis]
MERLTRRLKNGKVDCAACEPEWIDPDRGCTCDCPLWQKQLEKLTYYEDLAEQGRLMELPARLGDYFTYTDKYSRRCFRVDEIGVDERGIKLISLFPERSWYYFNEHPESFEIDDGVNHRKKARLEELEENNEK